MIVEMSLAHTVGSDVERSYRRTDLFAKRAKLMADWAAFAASPTAAGAVVPLRAPLSVGVSGDVRYKPLTSV